MKFKRIHIDGFGIFNDLSIEKVPPGLFVFLGENEAGKSTLLAFLRAMLFGFPDGRSKENMYQPLSGGRHGGVLTIADQEGKQYMIERHVGPRGGPVTVTLPDGKSAGEEKVRELLGVATRDLFRSIFAFSLSELQQFESLDNEAVRASIYSAGIGTGKVSLPKVDRDLQTALDELFKPGGSKPIVNAILGKLDKVRKDIRATTQDIVTFDALNAELDETQTEIENTQQRQDEARKQYDSTERLLRAWDDWIELCAKEKKLAELPRIDTFPPDGISRLERIEYKLSDLTTQVGGLEEKQQTSQEEHDNIVVEKHVIECSEEISYLQRGRDYYDSAVKDLPLRKQELEGAEQRLAEGLQELGPEWDTGKLGAFDTSIAEREAIRSHRDTIRDATDSIRICQNRVDLVGESTDKAQKIKNAAEETLAGIPEPAKKNPDAIAVQCKTLEKIAHTLRKQSHSRKELENIAQREIDFDQQEGQLKDQLEIGFPNLPWWPAVFILLLFVSYGGIALSLQDRQTDGFIMIMLAGLVFAGYMLFRRNWLHRTSQDVKRVKAHLGEIESRSTEIDAQRSDAENSLRELEAQAKQLCDEIGIAVPPDEEAVIELANETEGRLQTCRQWVAASRNLQDVIAELESAQKDQEKAEQTKKKAENALSDAGRKWAEWVASKGLREQLTPDGALEMVTRIGQCRDRLRSVEDLRNRTVLMDESVGDYRKRVGQVAACCEQPFSNGDDAGVVVDRLAERLQAAQDDQAKRQNLGDKLADLEQQTKLLHKQELKLNKELEELLGSSDASDKEEFRKRSEIWQQRQQLQDNLSQRNLALEKIAGRKEHVEALKENLARVTTPDNLERVKNTAKDNLAEIDRVLETLIDKRGGLREQLENLESEERSGELRMGEQSLLAELRQKAHEWTVYAIAKALLAEARERYERERQPAVIRTASGFFNLITHERYATILAPPGEATLDVEDGKGHRKHMAQLSRATLEQLYFAIRLGLIREFSQRQEALPVVMDDVFVNFDPYRAEAALEAVLELAQTHQVLLFTCHPETCDLVREAAPSTMFCELSDGRLVEATN